MPEEKNYQFASDDISEFMSELDTPKQEFEQSKSIFDELPEDLEPEKENSREKVNTTMTKTASNAGGKLLFSVIDNMFPVGLGLLAKTETEKFKATENERVELEEALSRYMELKGGDIPPGVMVIILIFSIYGLKIPTAIQLRKANTIIATQRAENKKLRAELEELKNKRFVETETFNTNKENE